MRVILRVIKIGKCWQSLCGDGRGIWGQVSDGDYTSI